MLQVLERLAIKILESMANVKAAADTIPANDGHTIVDVHMPRHISIELVQGNELRHYEIFFGLFSILASTATGFGTARALSGPNGALTASSIAFGGLALIFLLATLHFRKKVYNGSVVRSADLESFTH